MTKELCEPGTHILHQAEGLLKKRMEEGGSVEELRTVVCRIKHLLINI